MMAVSMSKEDISNVNLVGSRQKDEEEEIKASRWRFPQSEAMCGEMDYIFKLQV